MNNWICSCKIQRRVTIISMSDDDSVLLDERQEHNIRAVLQRSLPEVTSVIQQTYSILRKFTEGSK